MLDWDCDSQMTSKSVVGRRSCQVKKKVIRKNRFFTLSWWSLVSEKLKSFRYRKILQQKMGFDFQLCNINVCSRPLAPWSAGAIFCQKNPILKIRWPVDFDDCMSNKFFEITLCLDATTDYATVYLKIDAALVVPDDSRKTDCLYSGFKFENGNTWLFNGTCVDSSHNEG